MVKALQWRVEDALPICGDRRLAEQTRKSWREPVLGVACRTADHKITAELTVDVDRVDRQGAAGIRVVGIVRQHVDGDRSSILRGHRMVGHHLRPIGQACDR